MIAANNPALKSWVAVPENSDFSIQNLPFGIFKTSSLTPRVGVRIGDSVLDLKTLFPLRIYAGPTEYEPDRLKLPF